MCLSWSSVSVMTVLAMLNHYCSDSACFHVRTLMGVIEVSHCMYTRILIMCKLTIKMESYSKPSTECVK